MKGARQTTLREAVSVRGIGVHSNLSTTMTFQPAEIDSGVVFVRAATADMPEREVRADIRAVKATTLATVLGDAKGVVCSTTEHVLAAVRGMGLDNVIVELDGPETPIMDGSAAPFVAAIEQAGLVAQAAPRRYLEVLKPVRVALDKSVGEIRPYAQGFRVETEIEFNHPVIGRQAVELDVDTETFRRDIAGARTFGFMRDVAKLWGAGYGLGASFENTIVIAEDRVLNPGGLRFADEFARHKALDAIGDLALAGAPILGAYRSFCGGHKLNHAVLTALIADRSAWRMVDAAPARRPRGYAEAPAAVPVPAYAPDVS